MVIQQDTRQKKKHHQRKEEYFRLHGIKVVNSKCLVGDYIVPSDGSVSVDTKQNIKELYSNLIQDHVRLRNELCLAQELGIKLYILVENEDGVRSKDDILKWKNPQYLMWLKAQRRGVNRKPPASNQQLLKMMISMEKKYGVTFLFCPPYESGKKVVELLGGSHEISDNEDHSVS